MHHGLKVLGQPGGGCMPGCIWHLVMRAISAHPCLCLCASFSAPFEVRVPGSTAVADSQVQATSIHRVQPAALLIPLAAVLACCRKADMSHCNHVISGKLRASSSCCNLWLNHQSCPRCCHLLFIMDSYEHTPNQVASTRVASLGVGAQE